MTVFRSLSKQFPKTSCHFQFLNESVVNCFWRSILQTVFQFLISNSPFLKTIELSFAYSCNGQDDVERKRNPIFWRLIGFLKPVGSRVLEVLSLLKGKIGFLKKFNLLLTTTKLCLFYFPVPVINCGHCYDAAK